MKEIIIRGWVKIKIKIAEGQRSKVNWADGFDASRAV